MRPCQRHARNLPRMPSATYRHACIWCVFIGIFGGCEAYAWRELARLASPSRANRIVMQARLYIYTVLCILMHARGGGPPPAIAGMRARGPCAKIYTKPSPESQELGVIWWIQGVRTLRTRSRPRESRQSRAKVAGPAPLSEACLQPSDKPRCSRPARCSPLHEHHPACSTAPLGG